ncbi:unnamed protein product [Cladocopium goreaui]|uniref:Uncharacterized protein n=1 Tax=Cladocopium goreaui TaxID=2562237 RepID=A0A9P1DQ59_9DINO|nr:unnamed protein product [Cladocopium goreaui]
MDWPLSVAEKQSRAFDLYQREVVAVEASLQAAERELRKLKDDQGRSQSFKDIGLSSGKADSHRKYVAMKAEEEKPERKATFDHQERSKASAERVEEWRNRSKTLDSTEEMVTWQESGGLIVER